MAWFHGNSSHERFFIIKSCSIGSVRFRQLRVPVDICFTNNVVDNNSLSRFSQANFINVCYLCTKLHFTFAVITVLYKSIFALTIVRSMGILAFRVDNCITWVALRTFVNIWHDRIDMNVMFIHRWNKHRTCKIDSTDFQSDVLKKQLI